MSLSKSDQSFSVTPERPVLDAALDAGLNLPHSCKGGNCGACRARLLEGSVSYPNGPPLGLSDAEVAEGFILLCQARARSDLCIEALARSAPGASLIKRLPARIIRTEVLSHDVLGVFLRLPAADDFEFQPGQYLDVMLPGGRRRSFSIASPPHDASPLELHIRRVRGGEFTDSLFAEPSDRQVRSTLLSIEGPLGDFTYRHGDAPMLLVGGGTGLAPLKSILRHVIDNGLPRRVALYWGVRSERDLYAYGELEELVRRAPLFRYEAVLSEPDQQSAESVPWRGRRGWVHEAVLQDFGTLAGIDIYASGPPALIAAVRRDFALRGADPQRLFFDSFDYAPDTLERHRTSAATKS